MNNLKTSVRKRRFLGLCLLAELEQLRSQEANPSGHEAWTAMPDELAIQKLAQHCIKLALK